LDSWRDWSRHEFSFLRLIFVEICMKTTFFALFAFFAAFANAPQTATPMPNAGRWFDPARDPIAMPNGPDNWRYMVQSEVLYRSLRTQNPDVETVLNHAIQLVHGQTTLVFSYSPKGRPEAKFQIGVPLRAGARGLYYAERCILTCGGKSCHTCVLDKAACSCSDHGPDGKPVVCVREESAQMALAKVPIDEG
jgi:hypothetical protein